MKRLVMRSPFDIPRAQTTTRGRGDPPLSVRRPHRAGWRPVTTAPRRASRGTCSPVPAVRLEPLFEELLPEPDSGRSAARRRESALLRGSRIGAGFRGFAAAAARRGEERDRGGARVARGDGGGRCRFAGRRVRGPARRHAGAPPHCRRHRHRARRAASPRRSGRGRPRAAARDDGGAARHAVAVGRAIRAARGSDGRRRHDSDRGRRPGGRRRDPAAAPICRSVTWRRSPACRTRRPISFPGPCRASSRSTSMRSGSRRWSATCARRA